MKFKYRRCTIRAFTNMHPPPYLGITSSRYGASILSADISGHSVTGGTTDEKTQPVNVMELFYGLIRKQAWTDFHPPPLIEYGRPIVTIKTGSQRAKPVPD